MTPNIKNTYFRSRSELKAAGEKTKTHLQLTTPPYLFLFNFFISLVELNLHSVTNTPNGSLVLVLHFLLLHFALFPGIRLVQRVHFNGLPHRIMLQQKLQEII